MSDVRILVIAPHHDDEAIGCGGLLLTQRLIGARLDALYVFAPLEGVNSPAGIRRLEEAATAATVLGIGRTQSLGIPCREDVSLATLAWEFVKVFRGLQPTVLLIPHENERDPEHRSVHQAALEAAWLSVSGFRAELGQPAAPIETVLCYEVWTPIARPQLLVDISDVIDDKRAAIRAYASQLEATSYDQASAGLARYRGAMMANCKFAEAFSVEKVSQSASSLAFLVPRL